MIKKSCVQCIEGVTEWKEAIYKVAKPMVKEHIIENRYVEAMIETVNELGAYIVITPNIALPHASPDKGALKTGMSILKLKHPVYFDETEESKASLLIAIACVDNETHMKMLQSLVSVLMDEEKLGILLSTEDEGVIYRMFSELKIEE